MTKKRSKISETARKGRYDELFAAVGDALTCWVAVEDAAFLAFAAIIEAKHPEAVSAAFHALSTFSPRLDMIHAAMTYGLQRKPTVLKEWNKFHERLKANSTKRNRIAHLAVWWVDGRAVLGPSYLNVRGTPGPRTKLAVSDVRAYAADFLELFDDLYAFVYEKLPKKPVYVQVVSDR
jgi:hypothetical protein